MDHDQDLEVEDKPAPRQKPAAVVNRHHSEASRREQALCIDALDSGKYDDMSDAEWVALCERIAREASESA